MKCHYPEESPYCAFHYNGTCSREHNYECPALVKRKAEKKGDLARHFPPDYIDRRKLVVEMMKLIPTRLYTEEDMLDLVNEQPRADVVEVVRCGNCKHWNEKKRVCEHPEWTDMDGWHKATDAGDYCFRAE